MKKNKLQKKAAKLLAELSKELQNQETAIKLKLYGPELSDVINCIQCRIDFIKSKPLDKKGKVNEERAVEVNRLENLRATLVDTLTGTAKAATA